MEQTLLTFEEWYDLNEEDVCMENAESGADRELDFDPEKDFEKRYEKYLDSQPSELKILRSAAGYYIGRTYVEDGMEMPYSRESACYYAKREQAQKALESGNYPQKTNP